MPEDRRRKEASTPPTEARVRFQDLMRRRVQNILLVSSLYESFILAEDGQLNQALLDEFLELNLSTNPDLVLVSSGEEALQQLGGHEHFDLVITSLHIGDMDAPELATRVHVIDPSLPVVLLAFDNRELTDYRSRHDMSPLDRTFLWQGDVRILVAITKYTEDRLNVAHDTGEAGVPVIIVVEDNVRYYSSFLPAIYTELMKHIQSVIFEGVNISQKFMRMRARPKVLLCETFEEAWGYYEKYEREVLGVISDVEFPWKDGPDSRAGVELAARIHARQPDLPIMLQSSMPENQALADSRGVSFLLKGSPTLLEELRHLISTQFGFGDFVFRLPDGREVDRARDLRTLVQKLRTVPPASLAWHAECNQFSNWFKARGEFALARRLRPQRVRDFEDIEHLRATLIKTVSDYRRDRDRTIIADFDRNDYDSAISISRIGGGSLGGKARGLAFINRLLAEYPVREQFPSVDVSVPTSVVLGTDIFDRYLDDNRLRDFALRSDSDAETLRRFRAAPFPEEARLDLMAFLKVAEFPLAVRSSSLLEDAPDEPLAGVYETYMLPNDDADPEMRLEQLMAAVKAVYASTFSSLAKDFLRTTAYRLEEEKMGVIIQRVVGLRHGPRFYPHVAGVARSHNFYPIPPQKAADGVVAVALGLGRTVVEGGTCFRFSPKHPQHIVDFSAVEDVLRNSQRTFFALDMEKDLAGDESLEARVHAYDLSVAEEDGTLWPVGSTYDVSNNVIRDGIGRPGARLVTFAPILKHGAFPLAAVLDRLLEIGVLGTRSQVEIEFALTLSENAETRPSFAFLQMRPLAMAGESESFEIGEVPKERVLCHSGRVLGNGRVADILDVVFVDPERCDRLRTPAVALEIAEINRGLLSAGRPYLLIGSGRWGSKDPHLGIPVVWSQIAGVRVIVETGFEDLKPEPSQGTHFFQNLTSCHVGYFTVDPDRDGEILDWAWLRSMVSTEADDEGCVRHIRLDAPLDIKMNGQRGEGVIIRPPDEAS